MKKIVVFGATGNIGLYFVDYCLEHFKSNKCKDYEIIAVGRKSTNFFEKIGIKYIQADIRYNEDFDKLPTDDIYAIVNLAGILPAYIKEYNPFSYIDTNISGALRIMEYARKTNADRVLYSQTWAEQAGYWGREEILSPEMPRKLSYTGDHAFYSITKSMVVDTMEFYKQEYGIKSFIFRLPNVYLYNPQMFYYVDCIKKPIAYRKMIEQAIRGEKIELWGDPDAFKDILYVKDLCQLMFKALFASIGGGTYNAGTGIKTTLREQIEGIIEVFSSDHRSEIVCEPDKPKFISFVMNIENAKNELGYEPKYLYLDYLADYKLERELKRFDCIWEL